MIDVNRVRIGDVAAHAGVSPGTVSNVVNRPQIVRPDTRARVEAAMNELGYVPNLMARQLRQGRSSTIGLIVLDLANPFYTDLAHGASTSAEARGGTVLIAASNGEPSREQRLLRTFEEQRVRGVLLAPAAQTLSALSALSALDTPLVLIDGPEGVVGVSNVRSDHLRGGESAVLDLVRGGCTQIVCVTSDRGLPQVSARLEGARAAAGRAGVSIEVVQVTGVGIADGMAAADRVIAAKGDGPLGVFAVTDVLAFGLVQALQRSSILRFPDDIRVVGYDGIELSAASVPSISTVRQRAAELGSLAVEMLEDLISGERIIPCDTALVPEFVSRESSKSSHL